MQTLNKGDTAGAAWQAVFSEIKNPTKNATNPFLKNKYADLGQVIDSIKETLVKHGWSLMQSCQLILDGKAMRVETVCLHNETGIRVSNTADVLLKQFDPQGSMGAFTYGRRYGLLALFCLAAEDDDGNIASGKDESNTVVATKSHDTAVSNLKALQGKAK